MSCCEKYHSSYWLGDWIFKFQINKLRSSHWYIMHLTRASVSSSLYVLPRACYIHTILRETSTNSRRSSERSACFTRLHANRITTFVPLAKTRDWRNSRGARRECILQFSGPHITWKEPRWRRKDSAREYNKFISEAGFSMWTGHYLYRKGVVFLVPINTIDCWKMLKVTCNT